MIPWMLYKRILINTKLSVEEIVKLLSKEIAIPTTSFFGQTQIIGNKFYMGNVSNHGFEITRIIYTRNSFLPRIYGKFIPAADGTQVSILITLHPLIFVISTLLCAPLIMGFLILLGVLIYDYPNIILGEIFCSAIPLGLAILYYFFVLLGFGFEANEAEKYITAFFTHASSPA